MPQNGFVFKDNINRIWFASIKNLYKYDSLKNTFKPFENSFKSFTNGITVIRQLPNSIFTFGIRFGGIALMKDTNVIGTITEKEGLLDNSIKYLLPDGDRLWAATPKGISCISFTSYNPLKYSIKNFGENVGFTDKIIYQLIKYQGNILAATSKGIY